MGSDNYNVHDLQKMRALYFGHDELRKIKYNRTMEKNRQSRNGSPRDTGSHPPVLPRELKQRITGQTLKVGQAISAWIMVGPFDQRVESSGTTFRGAPSIWERPGFAKELKKMVSRGKGSFFEGDTMKFWEQEQRWVLNRQISPFVCDGNFLLAPHCSAFFLSTTLEVHKPSRTVWQLHAEWRNEAGIWLDNKLIQPGASGSDTFPQEVILELSPGKHQLTLVMCAIGVMRKFPIRMELTGCDGDLPREQIPFRSDPKLRLAVEKEAAATRFPIGLLAPGERLRVEAPKVAATKSCSSHFEVNGKPVEAGDWKSGACHLPLAGSGTPRRVWNDAKGGRITHLNLLPVVVAAPSTLDSVPDTFQERKKEFLETYLATDPKISRWREHPWKSVAHVALTGEAPPRDWLKEGLNWIAERRDCADFTLHALLRLLWLDRRKPFLTQSEHTRIRKVLTGFVYAADEIPEVTMFMNSENHRFLFHSGGWIAGLLYPDEVFSSSGFTGRALAARCRVRIQEWLTQRGRFGFSEWHSNSYLPINLMGLLNLYDYSKNELYRDPAIGFQSEELISLLMATLASDTFEGAMIGSQGRAYANSLLIPEVEGISTLCRLAFGTGTLTAAQTSGARAGVFLATSGYSIPELISAKAKCKDPHEALYRQGREPDGVGICYSIRRTSAYGLGAIEGCHPGKSQGALYVRALLPGGISVFGNCTSLQVVSDVFRPNYWSGNESGFQARRKKGSLLMRWIDPPAESLSHFHFPCPRFDEVIRAGAWILGRKNESWLALSCSDEFFLKNEGPYASQELVCRNPGALWVLEVGGAETPFSKARKLLARVPPPRVQKGRPFHRSPFGGILSFDDSPEADQVPLVESEWMRGDFGSGKIELRHGSLKKTLWPGG